MYIDWSGQEIEDQEMDNMRREHLLVCLCDFCREETPCLELVEIVTPWLGDGGEEHVDLDYACRECAESPALKMNAKF